jgi:hypothetical protein
MKLEWLRADVAGARRATVFLAVLLSGSLLANTILALLVARFTNRERVVLVPPTIHKTFWVNEVRQRGRTVFRLDLSRQIYRRQSSYVSHSSFHR